MPDIALYALTAILFLTIGIAAGYYLGKLAFQSQITRKEWEDLTKEKTILETKYSELEYRFKELNLKEETQIESIRTLEIENAKLESDYKNILTNLDISKKEWEENRKNMQQEFASIANKILLENSERIHNNSLLSLESFLKPFKENLNRFELKLESTQKHHTEESISLRTEIKKLAEMNQTMSEEAQNLTRALKGESKLRGNWGEAILERILEASGLEKGIHYRVQESFTDDGNSIKRPDIVIDLPDQRHLVIDSKVSLIAYENYCNSENREDRTRFLKEHIISMERHARELSDKKYHSLPELNSPDFVLLFVPIENALNLVLKEKEDFFHYFFSKNIIPVTSLTLLFSLKMIGSLWKQENQNKNSKEIAKEAGNLYDKFADFCKDLLSIGSSLESTQKHYENAIKKLSEGKGNLVTRAEKIRKLGANTTKDLPISDSEDS
jgi:DNA recombination protein RmuC